MLIGHDILNFINAAAAQATNFGKTAVLIEALADPVLGYDFKRFLRHAIDPSYNYYITAKNIPAAFDCGTSHSPDFDGMCALLLNLHNRFYTGNEALSQIMGWLYSTDAEHRWLFRMCIERQLPNKIGHKIVNNAAPDLIYQQPYGGCKSWDADMVEKRFDFGAGVFLQDKEDGMTMFFDSRNHTVRTRQGQDVTAQMFELVRPIFNRMPEDQVVHFEAKLWNERFTEMLPRPAANGIFNAIFSTGRYVDPRRLVFVALDMIPSADFSSMSSNVVCSDRYLDMQIFVDYYNACHNDMRKWATVELVRSRIVYSLAMARELVQKDIASGMEGGILKDPKGIWKNGKMTSQMKMKNEFECTLMVYGINPHKKNPEWVGSLLVCSVDGKIKTAVGSGLNEDTDSDLCRMDPAAFYNGLLVEVRAEKISKNNALDLPRIIEIRRDKDQADTYDEVVGAYNDSISVKC